MPGDTITNKEAIDMMNRCKEEIRSLRSVIDRLKPKADQEQDEDRTGEGWDIQVVGA